MHTESSSISANERLHVRIFANVKEVFDSQILPLGRCTVMMGKVERIEAGGYIPFKLMKSLDHSRLSHMLLRK